MGMAAQSTRRWTAREVRELIADAPLVAPRYELVDGELLVTPSPRLIHQFAVSELLVELHQYVRPHGIGRVTSSPADVELEAEDVRQPDLFVVSREEADRVLRDGLPIRSLLLAVEVLSPSSARHDRVVKRPGYQRYVGEYWIVDVDARVIERWQRGAARPEVLTDTLSWHPEGAREPFRLSLPEYFERVCSDS